MNAEQAIIEGAKLPFAYIRTLSSVYLGENDSACMPSSWEDLLEARFFGENQEIRIYWVEDRLQACILREEDAAITLTEKRKILNPLFGRELTICKELDYDQDGQAYVRTLRLAGWKGGEENGNHSHSPL